MTHPRPVEKMTQLVEGRQLTTLDCKVGEHTGGFAIFRVELEGRRSWACQPCIARTGARQL